MARDWTAEQKRAIETYDRNLLVSAAAGSGKTAVLAERCAYLVCDAQPPCNADELLVVTFTVAAAEEMRRRIGAALSTRATLSTDPRLIRQPLLLAGAQIGTIHGLCSSILRRHFHEAGLDPNFRLLDDDEAKLLRRDVADALVERKLEGPDADVTVRLLEHYAGGSASRIVGTLLGLHGRLSSLCDPDKWLTLRKQKLADAAKQPIRESELGCAALKILTDRLDTLILTADRLNETFAAAGVGQYATAASETGTALTEWRQALSDRPFDQAADIIKSTEFPRLPTVKDAELRDRYKPRIDALKRRVNDFAKGGLFLFTERELQIDLGRTLWAVDALATLTDDFEVAYATAKRDANTLDFSDLERFALRLLRDDETGGPTPIAQEYQRHFKHVLVDEYQDVNELQDTLLAMLSRESDGNLFCVGDVKQSIYRFRQADPARFIARYRRYKPSASEDGDVIDMRMNFRSRGPLLETLNGLFEALMTKESAEVNYDRTQRLVPGATFSDESGTFTGRPIELHVIETKPTAQVSDYDGDEREAVLTAARISELLGRTGKPPAKVTDRNGIVRDANPGDFAVLLRTVRIKAERYASVLRRAGLPVQADSTTGFFQSVEVRDLLCALRLIDNTRNEYDLAGHLRSPLCDWPDAEDRLATIRIAYPTRSTPWFHRAASRYANEQNDLLAGELKKVFARIDGWRSVAAERPVADLVWHVLQDTHYLTWCAGLPDGEQRVANLTDLHERARAFDRFRRPTLSRFLHYLATLEEQADLGMPSLAVTEQKAVRILSVHKSKGLEFPVVVIPDLGKDFNLRDAADTLLVDDAVGIGLRVVDIEREAHYPSLASTVAQFEIRRRSLAEELRVLYVAATRAREHLILIGTDDPDAPARWDDAWRGHRGPMPAGEVLAARTMLDWVGPAAAQTESTAAGSIERTEHSAESVDAMADHLLSTGGRQDRTSLLSDLKPLAETPPQPLAVRQAIKRIEFAYPHRPMTMVPAVETVTDRTKRGRVAPGGESQSQAGVVKFDSVLRPARCMTSDRTLLPVDLGALTHTVLQRLNFAGDVTVSGIRQQVQRLAQRRFLRADVADQADVEAVAWFAGTDLGRRCRDAGDRMRREFEVVFSAAADDAPSPEDQIMVRGRIDAMLIEDDGLVLIDYKTDRVTAETVDARVEFYRPQIDAYRTQLQRITKRSVTEAFLVFTTPRLIVPV
ncbi:MAG TPA: helicase-exonuclease AddAB subunit AddA [Tepidisphaeraceae bacterium]|jgi:ATP-dependent helicase/nuclease subunit A